MARRRVYPTPSLLAGTNPNWVPRAPILMLPPEPRQPSAYKPRGRAPKNTGRVCSLCQEPIATGDLVAIVRQGKVAHHACSKLGSADE